MTITRLQPMIRRSAVRDEPASGMDASAPSVLGAGAIDFKPLTSVQTIRIEKIAFVRTVRLRPAAIA